MDIDRIVVELGVSVRTGTLPDGWWGAYNYRQHQITLRPRLGALQRRSTMFHELGHAYYRHAGSTRFSERQASVWAATQMITEQAFIDACQLAETPQGMAHILGVLPRDVETYISTLTPNEINRITDVITP